MKPVHKTTRIVHHSTRRVAANEERDPPHHLFLIFGVIGFLFLFTSLILQDIGFTILGLVVMCFIALGLIFMTGMKGRVMGIVLLITSLVALGFAILSLMVLIYNTLFVPVANQILNILGDFIFVPILEQLGNVFQSILTVVLFLSAFFP
jgi:hypothetical protein